MDRDYHRGKFIGAWLPVALWERLAAIPGTTMRERVQYLLEAQAPSNKGPGVTATLEYVAGWKVVNKRKLVRMLLDDMRTNGWDADDV